VRIAGCTAGAPLAAELFEVEAWDETMAVCPKAMDTQDNAVIMHDRNFIYPLTSPSISVEK
jgi:hypothetical protein